MHEWSVSDGIVRAALAAVARDSLKKVKEVVVYVGELAQLDISILQEAVKIFSENTVLEGVFFRFEVVKAEFECKKCGATWTLKDVMRIIEEETKTSKILDEEGGEYDIPLHYMPEIVYAFSRCPKCGSKDFEVKSGLGVKVEVRGE